VFRQEVEALSRGGEAGPIVDGVCSWVEGDRCGREVDFFEGCDNDVDA
jgi:hypothetical protein